MLVRPTGLLGKRRHEEGLMTDDRRSTHASAARPQIGVDEWVARGRGAAWSTAAPAAGRRFERVPRRVRFAAFIARRALVPLLSSNEYVIRVGVDTLIYALLALGLNVVVGFAGLLDLGYVAFFGFGAYTYALLSSRPVRASTGRPS